jgi:hypothetical protein
MFNVRADDRSHRSFRRADGSIIHPLRDILRKLGAYVTSRNINLCTLQTARGFVSSARDVPSPEDAYQEPAWLAGRARGIARDEEPVYMFAKACLCNTLRYPANGITVLLFENVLQNSMFSRVHFICIIRELASIYSVSCSWLHAKRMTLHGICFLLHTFWQPVAICAWSTETAVNVHYTIAIFEAALPHVLLTAISSSKERLKTKRVPEKISLYNVSQ